MFLKCKCKCLKCQIQKLLNEKKTQQNNANNATNVYLFTYKDILILR